MTMLTDDQLKRWIFASEDGNEFPVIVNQT